MNARLKRTLLSLDDRLQGLFSLKAPVYTSDANVLDGDGVYSAAEWSRTRRMGSSQYGTDGHQYDSDQHYLRYICRVQGSKIASALSLADTFDFGRFSRVLELGCGDMIQAFLLKNRFPNLEYVASDFDPYVIARCSALPLLAGIEKRVFDVLKDPHEACAGFDLVMSWGLDAALDDTQLTDLLMSIRRLESTYLMCSPSTLGPIMHVRHLTSSRERERQIEQRRIRMHGWSRSVRYFRKLARTAGVPVRPIGRHGLYTCLLFGR